MNFVSRNQLTLCKTSRVSGKIKAINRSSIIDNKIANLDGALLAANSPVLASVTAIREKYTPTIGPIKKPIENAAPIIALNKKKALLGQFD